jgi:hypothetical protein
VIAMPKNRVEIDIRQFKAFEKKLEKLQKEGVDQLMQQAIRAMVSRFSQEVVRRTPVGDYGDTGKQGGTLRKGWNTRNFKKTKDGYEVEIFNDVNYAPYVEHGHLTANKDPSEKRWIKGRFMLRNTEIELTFIVPEILEQQFNLFIAKNFK